MKITVKKLSELHKPAHNIRLSGFTKDEFLNMMTKGHDTYSKAQVIRSV